MQAQVEWKESLKFKTKDGETIKFNVFLLILGFSRTKFLMVTETRDLQQVEFRPTILTTNQPFSKWPDVFGDAVIANAIIDRLVHHCDIVKITGHSYRIKGRNIFDDSDD